MANPLNLYGGPLLAVNIASEYTLDSSTSSFGNTMKFYNWMTGVAVSKGFENVSWCQWTQDGTYCAIAFKDYILLAR